jgi:hypothetical protein
MRLQLVSLLTIRGRAPGTHGLQLEDLEDDSMSQSKRYSAASRQNGHIRSGRRSATTAEGIANERAVLAARRRGRETSQATRAARRLEHAARADARAG